VTFLQRTFTSLVHAHAGRTQTPSKRRFAARLATSCSRLWRSLNPQESILEIGDDEMTKKIDLWDKDNNYIWGKLKDDDKIDLWDKNNNYIWGKLTDGGKIELWDKDNNYIWGKLNGEKIELWDRSNNYIWGKLQ